MSLDAYPLVSDWLRMEPDRLVVRTGKVDIGQRISTALMQIVADELLLPTGKVALDTVSTASGPNEGMTSGSNSIMQSGEALRRAAATLRELALRKAAERGGGSAKEWKLTPAGLGRPRSNRVLPVLEVLSYVDFDQPVDRTATSLPRAKAPRAPMRGIGDMVTGRFAYLHDLERPGMLHARVARPPHFHGRLKSRPDKAISGIEKRGLHVLRDGSFLAVVGENEWEVERGARVLADATEWETDAGPSAVAAFSDLTQAAARRIAVIDGRPRPGEPVPEPPKTPDYRARYERPFTLHGPLAPSAALAEWDGTRLRVTTHSQGIHPLRESIAESLDLPLDCVELRHHPGSGCYGHTGADDAALDAALVAMMIPDRPVLLKWTREQEHRWSPCGTMQAVELAVEMKGDRMAWLHVDSIGGTFRGRPRPGPSGAGPSRLSANWLREKAWPRPKTGPNMNPQGGLHRNLDPIYRIPRVDCVKNLIEDMPLRTSALRSLGAAVNVFGLECLLDEICTDRRLDPFEFRIGHLDDPRAVAVLNRLRARLGTLPPSAGRGIAYAQYKNAMARVGVGVDLRVGDDAHVSLQRMVVVADAGRVIDAAGLEAQLEGGALQAASWALFEEPSWGPEGITSLDWDSYPVLRFDAVPDIEVIMLDHPDDVALGAGEAACGPALAAIGNAIHDATGLRLRRLPMTPDEIRRAALSE